MLLTSAQVSVAISSTIVSIFTITLFLSGYILQQRTVTSIREAIKPKIRPTHAFGYDPQATAVPVALSSDGVPVIEVPVPDGNAGDIPVAAIEQVGTISQEPAEEINPTPDQIENAPQLLVSQQTVVLEDQPIALSRIRRPSQVENDKKDKEWAARLKKLRKKMAGEEDISVDHLSRAARRKLFKQQLSVQEGQQPVDPNAYRPRRRLW